MQAGETNLIGAAPVPYGSSSVLGLQGDKPGSSTDSRDNFDGDDASALPLRRRPRVLRKEQALAFRARRGID